MNHPARPRSSGCLPALIILASVAAPVPAHAHVKWFAPYIVGAPPQSIGATLTNVWFWTGIALVLAFFLASRAIEKSSAGETILLAMDRITEPLWMRLDDFVRVVIAAFFVAIFAVGGVYLTPDLKTPAEWVSWTQLLIAGIGHALIMAVVVAIAADHSREVHFLPALKRRLAGVPAGLAAALVIFTTGYWGLHIAIYGIEGDLGTLAGERLTHTPNPEHPHGMHGAAAIGSTAPDAYRAAMDRMHGPMMRGITNADPDTAFVLGMIPHHQGAVDMAEIVLKFGKDPRNQHFAREIIDTQRREIGEMRAWLSQKSIPQP